MNPTKGSEPATDARWHALRGEEALAAVASHAVEGLSRAGRTLCASASPGGLLRGEGGFRKDTRRSLTSLILQR